MANIIRRLRYILPQKIGQHKKIVFGLLIFLILFLFMIHHTSNINIEGANVDKLAIKQMNDMKAGIIQSEKKKPSNRRMRRHDQGGGKVIWRDKENQESNVKHQNIEEDIFMNKKRKLTSDPVPKFLQKNEENMSMDELLPDDVDMIEKNKLPVGRPGDALIRKAEQKLLIKEHKMRQMGNKGQWFQNFQAGPAGLNQEKQKNGLGPIGHNEANNMIPIGGFHPKLRRHEMDQKTYFRNNKKEQQKEVEEETNMMMDRLEGIINSIKVNEKQYKPDLQMENSDIFQQTLVEPPVCKPKYNIFYLKVHKTASSTTATLLFRVAMRHDLTIVPVNREPYEPFFPEHSIFDNVVAPPPGAKAIPPYDIMAEHAKVIQPELDALVGKNATYIATLRFPLSQFISFINEFPGPLHKFNLMGFEDPAAELIKNADYFYKYDVHPAYKNPMSKQMGVKPNEQNDLNAINRVLEYVRKRYDLIMFSEYYDESLVLLRRLMCWETEDIVYISQRMRSYSSKEKTYSNEIRQKHKQMSPIDYYLYENLIKDFHEKLSEQPNDFWEELHQFRQILSEVNSMCSITEEILKMNQSMIYDLADMSKVTYFSPQPWGNDFQITPIDCAMMKLDTMVLRNLARMKMWHHICMDHSVKFQFSLYARQAIQWDEDMSFIMHPVYCSEWHPVHQLPLQIFLQPGVFSWQQRGVVG